MPYTYRDANGHLAGGPNIRTWRRMRAMLQQLQRAECAALSQHGRTDNPQALSVELDGTTNPALVRLQRIATKAHGMLAITDGVVERA